MKYFLWVVFALVACSAAAEIPHELVIDDRFSYVEINHIYSDETSHWVLDQVIFWDWIDEHHTTKQAAQAWVIVKDARFLEDTVDGGKITIPFQTQSSRDLEVYKKLNREFKKKQIDEYLKGLLKKLEKRYGKELAAIKHQRIIDDKAFDVKLIDYTPPFTGSRFIPTKYKGKYVCVFHHDRALRRITCDSVVETWTTIDPEVANREVWDKKNRRGFSRETRMIR